MVGSYGNVGAAESGNENLIAQVIMKINVGLREQKYENNTNLGLDV